MEHYEDDVDRDASDFLTFSNTYLVLTKETNGSTPSLLLPYGFRFTRFLGEDAPPLILLFPRK